MLIRYPDGKTVEGFLLARDQNSMRVALQGSEDTAEFIELQGNWVSSNRIPVEIVFEWQRRPKTTEPAVEADFICPKELAAHLIHLLEADGGEPETERPGFLTAGQNLL